MQKKPHYTRATALIARPRLFAGGGNSIKSPAAGADQQARHTKAGGGLRSGWTERNEHCQAVKPGKRSEEKEAATQDRAACPEQTKAGEKHDKLRSEAEHPEGIA